MRDDNTATVIRSGGNPVYHRKAEHVPVSVPAVSILRLARMCMYLSLSLFLSTCPELY